MIGVLRIIYCGARPPDLACATAPHGYPRRAVLMAPDKHDGQWPQSPAAHGNPRRGVFWAPLGFCPFLLARGGLGHGPVCRIRRPHARTIGCGLLCIYKFACAIYFRRYVKIEMKYISRESYIIHIYIYKQIKNKYIYIYLYIYINKIYIYY